MPPKSRIVVSKTARYSQCKWQHHVHDHDDDDDDDDHDPHVLNLMMICCEEQAPYGPAADTANMFLDLLGAAYERYHSICTLVNQTSPAATAEEKPNSTQQQQQQYSKDYTIRITVYHAQSMDYPKTTQAWNCYHGIIIPGSFSTAYDTHIEWIHRLMTVIQDEIHANRRKTLGVCFGHQCFAHSFGFLDDDFRQRNNNNNNNQNSIENARTCCNRGGEAAKCSIGPIAGRKSFPLTAEGKFLFGNTASSSSNHSDNNNISSLDENKTTIHQLPRDACLEMLYTRGDMVQSLPSVGIALCGDEELANEACAYFASEEDLLQFRIHVTKQQPTEDSQLATSLRDGIVSRKRMSNDGKIALPYAITLQAHPEFMSPTTGCKETFINCVDAMVGHGAICHDSPKLALEEANLYHDTLLRDSLDAAVSTGVILGWF